MDSNENQPSISNSREKSIARGVVSTGWLAAETTFGPKDEGWVRRLTGASGVSAALHGLALLLALIIFSVGPAQLLDEVEPFKADLVVLLQTPGPGGGGGGNPAPAPPKPVEIPKVKAPAPIPIVAPAPVVEPPPVPELNTPVVTTNAAMIQAPGVSSVSLASFGGGGRGTGVGPGTGSGVGPGSGGGFGDGVYRPGSGATDPVPIRQAKPQYTSEAMRAKIQGEVHLEVVVLADGTVGDVRVIKSLDRSRGLDEEAIKAAKLWRFRPSTFQGKPVAILVTLILEFRLH